MNTESTLRTDQSLESSARREGLFSSLRALPQPAWVLFGGTFLNKFGAFVVPFLALYLTRQGHTAAETGLAVGAYGVGNLLASLAGGYLADRLGRRRTIILSMFSGAAAMMLLSQAQHLPAIVGLTLLTGLTGEFYRPACSALLADLVPPARRVTAFAALRVAFNAGFAFGPATAGFLASCGFFWLFAGDAGTSVLFGLVAWLALPPALPVREATAGWTRAWSVLRQDYELHRLLLANFSIALLFVQLVSTFGLHVVNLGFSTVVYGAVISLNGVLIVLVELPLTVVTRRFPPRRVMAVGYTLCGIGFALNGLARTVAGLVACMIVFTLGEMITMPTSSAYVANLAPAKMRGRYLGVSGLTWATALIVGPALGMKLYAVAPAIYWMACAALGLLAAAIISRPAAGEAGPARKRM